MAAWCRIHGERNFPPSLLVSRQQPTSSNLLVVGTYIVQRKAGIHPLSVPRPELVAASPDPKVSLLNRPVQPSKPLQPNGTPVTWNREREGDRNGNGVFEFGSGTNPLLILVASARSDVLESLKGELESLLGDDVTLHCVQSVAAARKALQNRRPQAVLIDHDMKAGGLASFARVALRVGLRAPAVFVIGAPNPELVALLRDQPEMHFIERPFRPEVAARRIRSVLQPDRDSDQSFHGLRLCELIQAFSLSRRDATLNVLTPDGMMGSVSIRAGRLVHVAFGDAEGMDALMLLVERKKGEIRIAPDCLTAKRTIDKPTQQVLLEVYRRIDEARAEDHGHRAVPGLSAAPSAAPSGAPRGENEQVMAQLDAMFVDVEPAEPKPEPPQPPEAQPPQKPRKTRQTPRAPLTPLTRLIHTTYRGIPPQTFPPSRNAPSAGAQNNAGPNAAAGIYPKNLPPKSVEEMIEEALDDKE